MLHHSVRPWIALLLVLVPLPMLLLLARLAQPPPAPPAEAVSILGRVLPGPSLVLGGGSRALRYPWIEPPTDIQADGPGIHDPDVTSGWLGPLPRYHLTLMRTHGCDVTSR